MTETGFNAQARHTQTAIETIQTDGLHTVRDLVERTRDRIISRIATSPSAYDLWFHTQLEAEAGRLLHEMHEPLTKRLTHDVRAAADAIDAAYEPLQDFGLEVGGVGWTQAQVAFISQANIAERISNLIDDGQAKIKDVLQQGMLGVMTPQEVQRAIAGNLEQAAGFGPLWFRADMIWTTEVNGVANRAAIAKSKEIESRSPGKMLKSWLHSGNTRWPRQRHIDLGQLPPQPIDEPYDVGGTAADGPHDASLPASEVIKCGCTLIVEFA